MASPTAWVISPVKKLNYFGAVGTKEEEELGLVGALRRVALHTGSGDAEHDRDDGGPSGRKVTAASAACVRAQDVETHDAGALLELGHSWRELAS